jgi:polyisoprenoid-binding protein YceI
MNVDKEDINSEIEIVEGSENEIKSVTFKVPVKSLKSGKGRMDKNTYEALKADDHNSINFESTSIKKVNGKLYAVGNLTIAGTTKSIEIPLDFNKSQQGISLAISYKINMLDYNVEPPTAMFGTITTGESVVVKINLIY